MATIWFSCFMVTQKDDLPTSDTSQYQNSFSSPSLKYKKVGPLNSETFPNSEELKMGWQKNSHLNMDSPYDSVASNVCQHKILYINLHSSIIKWPKSRKKCPLADWWINKTWPSLTAQFIKNWSAMQEIPSQFLGKEDPLEKGKATHSSILAWRIPRTI